MSEEYQRFKQNFFKQHPPSSQQLKTINQTAGKSFKQYDPYNEYTSDRNNNYRTHSDEKLRIQNQTHFPFQDIQQNTFQDFEQDPFLAYNQRQNFSNGIDKSGANHNPLGGSNHLSNQNESYDNQYRNYANNQPARDIPIRTESQLEYRTVSKHQFPQDNYLKTEQSGIEKINNQIDKLRVTRQQNFSQPPHQISQFQPRRNPAQNNYSQHAYEMNKQYVVQNNRTNNLLPASPPKQLPVIYNRPNSLSNSQHKMNPPSSNSRLIIQQGPPQNQQKGPVYLAPPPNPMNPVVLNQPQTFNQIPQIPQGINSGSRVVIQSEIVGQNKGLIQSSHNIPPQGYNITHQPMIINGPPQVHFDTRNVQEGMIPLKEYERLKGECSMWQQKFYQANDQLNRTQSERGINSYGQGFSQETILLKEENTRLMEKMRVLQNSEKNSYDKIKSSYEELIKKYQGSLMKEANLLVDRFRLQMKHNERY